MIRLRMSTLLIATAAAVGVSVFQGCKKPAAKPNILLISIDTCRADHLGCYGKRGAGTRHLDALAAQGVLFENVLSPVPLTLPAHSSMMTGTVPPAHGVHDNFHYRLGDAATTLAERLQENGYATVGVVATVVLSEEFGLAQGFDTYDDEMDADTTDAAGHAERRGQVVSDFATNWLSQRGDKPFFMFLHYYDPHHVYEPPLPFSAMYAADAYAGEIAYVDNCIGAVLEHLKTLGLFDSTLIVVTADHGEGRGDHAENLHGFYVYHSTTKVPLIIKPPGKRESKRIEQNVGLIDIAPTILALAGVPSLEGAQGVDLSPLMQGRPDSLQPRHYYGESLTPTKYGCTSLRSLESNKWKYIQAPRPELYDIQNDPKEEKNVYEREPQLAKTMRNRLKDIVHRLRSEGLGAEAIVPNAAMVVKMRSLGYVGGAVSEAFDFDEDAQDPKDFFPVLAQIEVVSRHMRMKEYSEAREAAAEALATGVGVAHIHSLLGQIAAYENKTEEAVTHYTEAVKGRPNAVDWRLDLGLFLARVGRHEEAIEQYRHAIHVVLTESSGAGETARASGADGHPLFAKLHFILGTSLRDLGRIEEAASAFTETLRIEPDHAEAQQALNSLPRTP